MMEQDKDSQAELRSRIQEIYSDPDIPEEEKPHRVQELMMENFNAKAQEIEDEPVDASKARRVPSYYDEKEGILGCPHYRRHCLLKAECCEKFVPCRFCHDEDSDHVMDRYETNEMLCMHCWVRQPVSPTCRSRFCRGRPMARYYCNVCNLFDDDPDKDIYHCDKCKMCRVGKGLGIDFFHCDTCNACMTIALTDHKCVEHSLESNCPICHDFLFTSTEPVTFMTCGHSMHVSCFHKYIRTNYTCPICCKSLADMSSYFARLDAEVQNQSMPEEYRNVRSNIFCSDCEERSTVPFHFMYHKCPHCGSYNTKLISTEETDSDVAKDSPADSPSTGTTSGVSATTVSSQQLEVQCAQDPERAHSPTSNSARSNDLGAVAAPGEPGWLGQPLSQAGAGLGQPTVSQAGTGLGQPVSQTVSQPGAELGQPVSQAAGLVATEVFDQLCGAGGDMSTDEVFDQLCGVAGEKDAAEAASRDS
eukprot:Rmarinus@m.13222